MGTLIYRLSYMLFSQCDIDSSLQDGGIHVPCLWAWVDFCNCLSQIKCGKVMPYDFRSWVTKGNSFCLAPSLTCSCSCSRSLSPLALEMQCCVVRKPSQYEEISVAVLADNHRQAPSQQLQATHVSKQSLKMTLAFTERVFQLKPQTSWNRDKLYPLMPCLKEKPRR